MNRTRWMAPVVALLGFSFAALLPAANAHGQETAKQYQDVVAKAVEYCETAQAPDGSFSADAGPAVTAIVAAGLLKNGRTADDPLVAKSLKYIEKFVRPDGGISGNCHGCPGRRRPDGSAGSARRYGCSAGSATRTATRLRWRVW